MAEEETESCVSGGTNRLQQSSEYSEGIYGKKGSMKKKSGLFRGLGSMFRFGRHRKSVHGPLSVNEMRKQQAEIERLEKEDLEQAELDKARQAAHAENLRIQVSQFLEYKIFEFKIDFRICHQNFNCLKF